MLYKNQNQIKRNYYLNLFSANAEIIKSPYSIASISGSVSGNGNGNGNQNQNQNQNGGGGNGNQNQGGNETSTISTGNNWVYNWNIRDLQLERYAEVALIQIANNNADYTEERQYPPKLYNSSTTETTATGELQNILPTTYYKQTITLNTTDITYGFGTYELYSSSIYNSPLYRKRELFNFNTGDVGAIWNSNYNGSTGEYNQNSYIKPDYLGDWIIIKLPVSIILTKFRFYGRLGFVNQAPSAWRCYGSNDGITFTEIKNASNDTTPLTLASYDTNRMYEKSLTTFNTSYNYIGFTFNKKIVDASEPYLSISELQLFGREKLNIMPPIMWYKFDASSTNMLLDSSGNNYNLTNNGATFDGTNFKRGYGSATFNHTTQQHLTIPSINLYNIQSKKGITFSVWFRMNTNTGTNGRIFDFNNGIIPTRWVVIARQANTNKIFFNLQNSTNPNANLITTNDFVDGNWHHIIWSINNVGRWTIYIDGVIASFTTATPTNINIENITFNHNFFGKSGFPADGYYNGNVDDFRIYDYILSPNEVSGLYYGTDPTTQNKYIIRSLNTYNDGWDSTNTNSAVLYMNNELVSPKNPTYHKLNTYNLNRISLEVNNDIEQNNTRNGWNPNINFGCVLHIKNFKDND